MRKLLLAVTSRLLDRLKPSREELGASKVGRRLLNIAYTDGYYDGSIDMEHKLNPPYGFSADEVEDLPKAYGLLFPLEGDEPEE